MALLDIEKAFDTVWHNGLLYKMHLFGYPVYLIKFIKSFNSNRSFMDSINNSNSNVKTIPAGVPQGSVSSPLIFSIFTSDFQKPKNSDMALYADDTALVVNSKLTKAVIKKLKTSINCIIKKGKLK